MPRDLGVADIHVFSNFDSHFTGRISQLPSQCLEVNFFLHCRQRLSMLYLPGPTKLRPKNTKAILMAWDAPDNPSPAPKCDNEATSITNMSRIVVGRKNNPMMRNKPPTVSTTLARKPQTTVNEVIPI